VTSKKGIDEIRKLKSNLVKRVTERNVDDKWDRKNRKENRKDTNGVKENKEDRKS
jgi:hypothetical protein